MQQLTIGSGLALQPASSVSDKYRFISTKEIMDIVTSMGWELKTQKEAGVRKDIWKGKQKHILIFENPAHLHAEGRIQLVIRNSHNAGSSLEIFFGFMRVVCTNQLFAKNLGNGSHFRVMHTEKGVERLKDVVAAISGNVDQLSDNINYLKAKTLSPQQVKVFAQEAIIAKYGEKSEMIDKIDFKELLDPKRPEDKEENAWIIFNRLQEQLTQGGLYYSDGKRMRKIRAIKSVNKLPDFNAKLWELANSV